MFDAASSLWVYPFIVLLSALDAFTIILPSETVVAGLSSTAVSLGAPNVFALGAAAALGAHLGDLGVFVVGRLLARLRWVTPGSRVDAAMRWTRRRLDAQGPLYIMTARYIPYGRLIVNATAGWTGFPLPAVCGALCSGMCDLGNGVCRHRCGGRCVVWRPVVAGDCDRGGAGVSGGVGSRPHYSVARPGGELNHSTLQLVGVFPEVPGGNGSKRAPPISNTRIRGVKEELDGSA